MRELAVLDASVAEATVRHAAAGDEVAFARLIAEPENRSGVDGPGYPDI
jgi:hypothetical protein